MKRLRLCHYVTDDKWQLKTLILAIYNLRSSIVIIVFDCRLSVVEMYTTHFQANKKTIDKNIINLSDLPQLNSCMPGPGITMPP